MSIQEHRVSGSLSWFALKVPLTRQSTFFSWVITCGCHSQRKQALGSWTLTLLSPSPFLGLPPLPSAPSCPVVTPTLYLEARFSGLC